MKFPFFKIVAVFLCAFSVNEMFSQQSIQQQSKSTLHCLTADLHERLLEEDDYCSRTVRNETLLYRQASQLVDLSKSQNLLSPCSGEDDVLMIPTVVHIVHSNEALGSAFNPLDVDVISVINQTNDRLRHSSGMTYDNPLSGADMKVELCLAKRDPNGNSTNGIVRHNSSFYSQNDFDELNTQAQYFWPTTDYLNIYLVENICDPCPGPAITSGYSSLAGGHGDPVDGIVLTTDDLWAALLAHEVGHYGNLRHTFLGSSCVNSDCLANGDFVCDTPPKDDAGLNGGTCSNPANTCTTDADDTSTNNPYRPVAFGGVGDVADLAENYMDYTGGCWTAFTQGQKERFRYTLISLRSSLFLSKACIPLNSIEAGISAIVEPVDQICSASFVPVVTITNEGTGTLSSVQIEVSINGASWISAGTWTGSLSSGASTDYTLPSQSFDSVGDFSLQIQLVNPNNSGPDSYSLNDAYCTNLRRDPSVEVLPICDNYESGSIGSDWLLRNSESDLSFEATPYTSCGTMGSSALLLATWGKSIDVDNTDALISPILDFSEYETLSFSLDLAYIQAASNANTVLDIAVSTDCGAAYTSLFHETGSNLASVAGFFTAGPWSPTSCSDWRTLEIDLDSYAGFEDVVIRLQTSCENPSGSSSYFYGQDLWLDNLCITGKLSCAPPAPIVAENSEQLCGLLPRLLDAGTPLVGFDEYTYQWYMDGLPIASAVNQYYTATDEGSYQAQFIDPVGSCHSPYSSVYIVSEETAITSFPYCEDFESGIPNDWFFDQGLGTVWQTTAISGCSANDDQALGFLSEESVSGPGNYAFQLPVLDLRASSSAEMNFDIAHRRPLFCNFVMNMDVLVSTDCGGSWTTLYSKNDHYTTTAGTCLPGPTFASPLPLHTLSQVPSGTPPLVPSSCSDWRDESISLTDYAGKTVLVRFEFQLEGALANNLYLDNVCVSATACATSTWYADNDGDGQGDAAVEIATCLEPDGFVANDDDCNDNSDQALLGGVEIQDGLDNNCNGVVDEGFGSRLFLSVFLEGNYDPLSNTMTSSLATSGLLPLANPYSGAPWLLNGFAPLPNQAAIPSDVVDYVLIEARFGTPQNAGGPSTSVRERQLAFLYTDGSIGGVDGLPGVAFTDLPSGQAHYFVIRHRNHLDVMTAVPLATSATINYDFSTADTQAYGPEQLSQLEPGVYGLFAGDFLVDGVIQNSDYDLWATDPSILDQYEPTDGNLDGVVQNTDNDIWEKNKAKVGHNEIRF